MPRVIESDRDPVPRSDCYRGVRERPLTRLVETLLVLAFTLLPASLAPPTLAQVTQLQYQNRGDRYEGIRPRPIGGYDVELLSVRADYKDEAVEMPDRLRLKLYLDRQAAVHLTVRELDYEHYYWMDRVQPERPWQPGFGNIFDWPARDVLRQLRGLKMYELGVVARLDRPEPDREERVAPVIFYQNRLPDSVDAYLFTFRTGADAALTWFVFKPGVAGRLDAGEIKRQPGGRPFTVRWDASQTAAGAYSVVLNGQNVSTGAQIAHTVSFYHQPRVR